MALVVAALALTAGCSTDPPTNVASTSATLNGHVDGLGKQMTWWFRYGPTTSYGSETPHRYGGAAAADQAVSETVTGLVPGRTYHYTACEEIGSAPLCFGDQTVTPGRLQAGFQETTAFSGLDHPTAVRFASDGRVFVAERGGLIKVLDSLTDRTPKVFADLRTNVDAYWDRGLLGLALDPSFPTKPYVYALYSHDAAIGGTAPRWGDACPTPPGPTTDGCVISGRLSRLRADGDTAGPEQVLIEDWCQQFPSHSVGDLAFGSDGALYASGGDGANFNAVDYGQFAGNPCGDPPGGAQTAPSAEGGALRSQSPRRAAGEPVVLGGSVIRVNPDTGAGLPDNPLASSPDANARRIVAYGLRNPFRFAIRPGTNEVWVADVGWGTTEEINRVDNPTGTPVKNFGWPCYEGAAKQPGYQGAGLALCSSLYAQGGATPPFHSYDHSAEVVPGDGCGTGSSSITGLEFQFYGGGPYPPEYDGALFFSDHSRNCIWVMERDGSVLPSQSRVKTFVRLAANPVDLQIGPGGDLFYVDFDGGTIRRIRYSAANRPPTAVATASPTSGDAPLTVHFDGTGSTDPDAGDALSYAWDLNGDGIFGDTTAPAPTFTYTQPGPYDATLRVTDPLGASSTSTVTVSAGNAPPTASIDAPASSLTWKVGDPISFRGSATDPQDGTLPPSALSWSVILHHCPSNCHTHPIQDFTGTEAGSFAAPDHSFPSYLELRLTATDSGGLQDTTSVNLDPQTARITMASAPSGLMLALNGETAATPFTRTVIAGSSNSLGAPSPQTLGGQAQAFSAWSDGGAQSHSVTTPDDRTYTGTYAGG